MDFKKMMEAKGKSKMSPMAKEAKLGVLGDLKKMASGMMSDDLKGLKKVTVASPDSSGLEEGLEKAKEMLGSDEESSEEGEHGDKVAMEYEKYSEDPSYENIESLISCLEEKKAELKPEEPKLEDKIDLRGMSRE